MSEKFSIRLLPAFEDNYLFVIDVGNDRVAVVDPGDADVISRDCDSRGKTVSDIFLTHHHWDHIGGVKKLKARYACDVWGHAIDSHRLPEVNRTLVDGETFKWQDRDFHVMSVPGHTVGHIIYYIPSESVAFVGDTVFNHGCGRMFEGSPQEFWESLTMLRNLPQDTKLYCAHEYTMANLNFCLDLEPENAKLREKHKTIVQMRNENVPTVPMLVGEQIETNPFLRCDNISLQTSLGLKGQKPEDVFAFIRTKKDQF